MPTSLREIGKIGLEEEGGYVCEVEGCSEVIASAVSLLLAESYALQDVNVAVVGERKC